jgi:hypothetical protein
MGVDLKMVCICPNCNEVIYSFDYVKSGGRSCGSYDGKDYEENELAFQEGELDFNCPECGDFITSDEYEAEELLRK